MTVQFSMIHDLPIRGPIVPMAVEAGRLPIFELEAGHGDAAQAVAGMKTLSRTLISASYTLGFAWPKFAQRRRPPHGSTTCAAAVSLPPVFLAERLAVQVDVAVVQPLAVMQPAAGEIQGVGVVIAEEPRWQLRHPDPASLVGPGSDLLGALHQHVFARRRPVGGTAAVLVPTRCAGA